MHELPDHDPFASLRPRLFASPRRSVWARERRSIAGPVACAVVVVAFAELAVARIVVDDAVDTIDTIDVLHVFEFEWVPRAVEHVAALFVAAAFGLFGSSGTMRS